MSGLPWTMFFFNDWQTEPGLKLCSLAAQGLWMRMLCIASQHEPPGYVAFNGKRLSVENLAALTATSAKDIAPLLVELEQFHAFSQSISKAEYIIEGWSEATNLAKMAKTHHQLTIGKIKEKDNQGGLAYWIWNWIWIWIWRSKKKNHELILEGGDSKQSFSNGFNQFWAVYPNKVGKHYAQKCFDRVARSREVTFAVMMDGLDLYVNKTDDRPWCNPSTWLNQHRWLDKPAQVQRENLSYQEQKAQKNADIEQRLEDAIARERNGTGTSAFQALPGIHED